MEKINLKEYYKTSHWRKFVKNILEPLDTVCELCKCKRWKKSRATGKKAINRCFNIHHKDYNNLYHETRGDVMILCSHCHTMCHDIVRLKPTTEFIQRLQEVARVYFTYNSSGNI